MLWDSVYKVTHSIPMPTLPDGYSVHSMAEEGSDIDKRRKAFGVSFNHPEPMEWPSRVSYQGLQQAPNYDQIWISTSSLQVESMSRSALLDGTRLTKSPAWNWLALHLSTAAKD